MLEFGSQDLLREANTRLGQPGVEHTTAVSRFASATLVGRVDDCPCQRRLKTEQI